MHPGRRAALARFRDTALLVLPVFVVHYFSIPGLYDPGLHSKYFFLACYLLLASVLLLFSSGTGGVLRQPIWWAAFGLGSIYSLSLFWANTPMEGLSAVARCWEAVLLIAVLTGTFAGKTQFHRILRRTATVFALLTATAAWLQLAYVISQKGGFSHLATYDVLVSFAHRNLLSHALALALPLVLLTFLKEKNAWWWIAGLTLALSAGLLLALLVRATWLALAAGGLVFLLSWWTSSRRIGPVLRRQVNRRTAFLLGLGMLAAGAAIWKVGSRPPAEQVVVQHAQMIAHSGYGSPGERALFWRRSIELWQDRPLLGHGAGQWKIQAPGKSLGGVRKSISRGEVFVVRAHNDPLQILAEAGPLALLCYFAVAFLGLRMAWRQIRHGQPEEVLRAWCYAPGILIFLVVAGFSFPMERPSSYVWWAIFPAALMLNGQRKVVEPGKWMAWSLRLGMVVLSGAMVAGGWIWMQKDGEWLRAMDAGSAGRHDRVVELLDDDLRHWMPLDPATTPLFWYRGMAWLEMQDTTAAIRDFEEALAVHPHHPQVLNNLATLLHSQGKHQRAREMLRRVVFIAPEMEDARLNFAALEYNLGRIDSAVFHLRAVPENCTHPNYPVFREAILRARMQQIVDKHAGEAVEMPLRAMLDKPKWVADLFDKAVMNELSLEHQTLIDAIYILHDGRKSISSMELDSLYNHYLLDSIN
jgi:O-antigen ligase